VNAPCQLDQLAPPQATNLSTAVELEPVHRTGRRSRAGPDATDRVCDGVGQRAVRRQVLPRRQFPKNSVRIDPNHSTTRLRTHYSPPHLVTHNPDSGV
jgi:hypothetical protein